MEPANKGLRYPAEVLTSGEVGRLMGACSGRAPTGVRNRALVCLLWRAGLRVSEALALRPKDVGLESGEIRVLHGKGDRARTVGLDPQAAAVIGRWMDRRVALGLNGVHPLLCTLAGKPVKAAYVRALLPRLARRAGIEKRVHAHGLRHTYAAELAREGVPLNVIQQQLGHENVATTSRYIDHVAPTAAIEMARGRSW